MIFKQYDNGSCDIEFSEEEIVILSERKKLHLSNENLKHFANNLMRLVISWNSKFDEKTSKMMTTIDTEIKTK